MKPDLARRARIQRLAAKRPDIAVTVTVERREVDDPVRRAKLLALLTALLDDGTAP